MCIDLKKTKRETCQGTKCVNLNPYILLSQLYLKKWAFFKGMDERCWFKSHLHLKPLSSYFMKFVYIIRSEQNRTEQKVYWVIWT